MELSEQELVSCDTSDNGCQGGSMSSAFRFIQQHGIASESAYSYTGRGGMCDSAKENKPVATVSGSRSVFGESGLKSAVSGRAVSIGVDATCLQHYHSGILDQAGCSGGLDHGVLAVGYGTSAGTPYFKVKNSWGTSWGESGFFRVVEGKGMLGIGKQSVYPTGVRRE
jgi:C1A family cysteine protease